MGVASKVRTVPRRIMVAGLSSALILFVTASCGGSSQSGGSKSKYVIGATLDLSGPTAAIGAPLRNSMGAYFDYINSQGGVNGHKIKFVALDDQFTGSLAVANLKQLLSQNPVVMDGIEGGATLGPLLPSL